MFYLRNAIVFMFLLFLGCSGGPVTPRDAFTGLMEKINSRDYPNFYLALSNKTTKKVETYRSQLHSLNAKQQESIALSYGLSAKKLLSLNSQEMTALIFMSDRSKSSLLHLTKEKIRAVKIHDKRATVETSCGIKLIFVKEGPYWKADLSDL